MKLKKRKQKYMVKKINDDKMKIKGKKKTRRNPFTKQLAKVVCKSVQRDKSRLMVQFSQKFPLLICIWCIVN